MKKTLHEDVLKEYWGNGKALSHNGKKYRVNKMSYGQYFLEPINWDGSETQGFSKDTLWLERDENKRHLVEAVNSFTAVYRVLDKKDLEGTITFKRLHNLYILALTSYLLTWRCHK